MNKGMYRYLFVVTALFTLSGCGDSSSVTDKKNIDRYEHQAVYIEPEKLSAEEIKMSKLIQNTLAHDEMGIGIEESIDVKEKNKIEKLHSNILYKTTVSKVLEDAEDGTTNGWINYDNSPKGSAIFNVYDNEKKSHVIEVKGSGYQNGFTLSLGNDVSNRTIKWSMKYGETYVVYIRVNTQNGYRYLYYTASDYNGGKSKAPYEEYIHHGLGSNSKNGTWQTFTRDLTRDLKDFENDNSIISVDGFYLRGSGRVDDIEFIEPDIQNSSTVIYEDAESKNSLKWKVYDKSPVGATVVNSYDENKDSNVITLRGNGLNNGYVLSDFQVSNGWHQRSLKKLSWSMKYSENFIIYVSVVTQKGHRYLYYTPTNSNHGNANSPYEHYIHHGLGRSATNGVWQTFTRDLEADLKEFEPDNSLVSTEAFLIRGSGSVDDIMMGEVHEEEKDTTPPVITLNGEATIILTQGSAYIEQSAKAVDAIDGEVSVTVSGEVNTAVVGVYTITYTAKDKANNSATKTRTITVVKKVEELTVNLEANATQFNIGDTIQLTLTNGKNEELTHNVEWIVTPADRAEITNNIVTAKKEGNITIEAKYQGKSSNKLLFDVRWVINGHMLPLEPDEEENNATLRGVDSNVNGVRDDVERKIRQKYPKPLQSALLMYDAKFYQRTLIEPTANAIEIQKDATRTIDCTMYLMKFDSEIEKMDWMNNSRYVKDLTFNNLDRIEKYWKYNIALSGGSYGSSLDDANIDACSQEVADVLEGMK